MHSLNARTPVTVDEAQLRLSSGINREPRDPDRDRLSGREVCGDASRDAHAVKVNGCERPLQAQL
jgi:hypothetical protein